jgi:hypothetical protein
MNNEVLTTRPELETILEDLNIAQEWLEAISPVPDQAILGVVGARAVIEKMLESVR